MLYRRALETSEQVKKEINKIEQDLKNMPEGKFVCSHTGPYTKWFVSDGKKYTYIPKSERPLAEKLLLKKCYLKRLKYLKREQKAINYYLNHHDKKAAEEESAFFASIEFQDLLSSIYKIQSEELQEWANAPYNTNTNNPESLKHKATLGKMVRSKSEVLIDFLLTKYQIPFRYECELELGGRIIYPDFAIRHPITGKMFYWEHFGMIDNPEYCSNMLSKLHLYISNGIYPSINLITTYETKDIPLDITMLEKIIEFYFL